MRLLRKARKLDGKIDFNGLKISIETGRSRVRQWRNPHDGTSGMTLMKIPYGYICGTTGVDAPDHVDCFVGQDRTAPFVYVIHIRKAPDFTEYDEDKCFIGFPTAEEAQRVFRASYNDERFYGEMSVWPFEEFKQHVLSDAAKGQALRKSAFTQNVKEEWARVTKSIPEESAKGQPRFITIDELREYARKAYKEAFIAAGGDWNANIPDEIYQGMKTELEHTDVTGGDLVLTAKIVIAHLKEDRKYYSKLETIEKAQAMRIRSGIFHSQNV